MRYWLKNLREEKNYSKTHVAELLGISRQYYSYIEDGERLPDLPFSMVVQLSKIFGVSLEKIKRYEQVTIKQEA